MSKLGSKLEQPEQRKVVEIIIEGRHYVIGGPLFASLTLQLPQPHGPEEASSWHTGIVITDQVVRATVASRISKKVRYGGHNYSVSISIVVGDQADCFRSKREAVFYGNRSVLFGNYCRSSWGKRLRFLLIRGASLLLLRSGLEEAAAVDREPNDDGFGTTPTVGDLDQPHYVIVDRSSTCCSPLHGRR